MKVKNTVPWTYVISDLKGEEIVGTFYKKELQNPNRKEFRVEKVIKRKGDKLYVNPIQDGLFRGYSRIGWGPKRPALSRICHTYATTMKLGTVIPHLKKIQKIYESRDTPFKFY